MMSTPVDTCDAAVLNSYKQQFPQLWKNHNLVIRLDQVAMGASPALDAVQVDQVEPINPAEKGSESDADGSQGYVLRLFVASQNTRTKSILETLHQLLDQVLDVPYTLKVIDVAKHPERAEADQISATPTLVKIWPKPVRRLVGDQLETDNVMQLLDAIETS